MKSEFLGAAYASRSLPLAGQTLVNLFFEPAPPGSAEGGMFYGAPGRKRLATVGDGPIRGLHTAAGFGWVVSGASLYRVDSLGASTLVGAVPGTGRCALVHNDTQLVVMHSAGWHVCTMATLAYAAVADAPTTGQGTYQDGYIVFPKEDGTYGWTPISDASQLDALNFASAEAQPDKTVSVLSDHRELWLFGEATTEVAQTSGDADLVFVRTSIMEYGCVAKHSPAKSNNTTYWLSRNESGQGMVMQAEGYSPARKSTYALEASIATYGDLSDAWGYCYQQNGHSFYVLTFPGRATWAYDAGVDRWTQLAYRNPVTGELEQARDNAYMFLGGRHVTGDYLSNKLYTLDLDTHTDDGDAIYWERAWAVIEADNKWIRHDLLEVIAEMGVGLDGAPTVGADPVMTLQWSDDGCRTWGGGRRLPFGRMGEYRNRAQTRRLGISRRRVYKLFGSDPTRKAIYGANLEAKPLRK